MARFCGNQEYAGVDRFCPRTCGVCEEKRTGPSINSEPLVPQVDSKETAKLEKETECQDKAWCNQLLCSDKRYKPNCPVTCGLAECRNVISVTKIDEDDNEHLDRAQMQLCVDKQPDTCAALQQLCDHEEYGAQVSERCPATCGVCETPPLACQDMADDCDSVKHMCEDPFAQNKLRVECPKTCGLCSSMNAMTTPTTKVVMTTTPRPQLECADAGPECAAHADRCRDTIYGEQFRKFCPVTCNACSTTVIKVTTTPSAPVDAKQCKDKHKNCPRMRGFCQHKNEQKRTQAQRLCPMTCKRCSATAEIPGNTTPSVPTTVMATEADSCRDRTPKWCETSRRVCKTPKYEKTMQYKCAKTCGFCSAATESTSSVAPKEQDSNIATQFSEWSVNWSKCSKGVQYKKRRCLAPPCNKRQLYKTQKC